MSEETKSETPENDKRGLVGIQCTDTTMLCWNLANDREIVCTARRHNEGLWVIDGRVRGETRITATVIGGKNAAKTYLKFIRNGLTSRVLRLKSHHRKGQNENH